MIAYVNEEVCTGCGICVDTCPDVFEMGPEAAEVIVEEVPPEAEETCHEAEETCPVEAIHTEE